MLAMRNLLEEGEKKRIYQSAVALLERVGLLCNHGDCLEAFREAGCRLGKVQQKPEGARAVFFTEAVLGEALAKAPKRFTVYPTAPAYRELKLLSGEVYFKSLCDDHIRDFETNEIRPGALRDVMAIARLHDSCQNIDAEGQSIFWMYDLIPKERVERYGLWDIAMALSCLHNGKPKLFVNATSTTTEIPTVLRTWQICAGGKEAFRQRPCGSFIVSLVSPYYLSGRVEPDLPWGHADTLVLAANAGAPISIEPVGLLGATGPVSLAGLIAQSIAELLGTNVAVQAIGPGTPVLLQDYTGSFDMSTGLKQGGTPEANLLRLGLTEMAHHLGLPIWTISASGACEADAQIGWENMAAILSQYLWGTDIVDGFGILAAESVFDPRALVMANEMIGWAKHLGKGIDMGNTAIPLDLMIELGTSPFGGDFLRTDHTLRHYKETMWQPSKLTNRRARDSWIQAGQVGISQRATALVREKLDKHEPDIPDDQQSALRGLIAEILDREGIKGDQAKRIMGLTYWPG